MSLETFVRLKANFVNFSLTEAIVILENTSDANEYLFASTVTLKSFFRSQRILQLELFALTFSENGELSTCSL